MLVPLLAMHIPDGLLSLPVSLVGWLILIVLSLIALRQTRDDFGDWQIPLAGLLAAFVFAAQMINFPVLGGTSGHLLGGVLVAVLLGPWASVLVMTSVIGVQALIFQDGGLLALGFNVANMGILSAFVGYVVYLLVKRLSGGSRTGEMIGAALGAWVGVVAASIATSVELAISGTANLGIALPAMVGVHALIGIGEALITVAALAFIGQTRPDLIRGSVQTSARGTGWIAAGLVITLAVTLASPLADPNPDGLERVAEDQGFIDLAQEAPCNLLPDYTTPGIENEALSTIAAGMIGTLIVAGVGYFVARRTQKSADASSRNA